MELQENSSQKFTDLWMKLCRASTVGDSSQTLTDLQRKLCRSRTGEAAGRLKLEVHSLPV